MRGGNISIDLKVFLSEKHHKPGVKQHEIIIFEDQLSHMDIQAEKLQLIEWLAKLNNTATLKRFITLKKQQEEDWWDQLSSEEKAEIEAGLAEADRGEVVPHKEVMGKYRKWR